MTVIRDFIPIDRFGLNGIMFCFLLLITLQVSLLTVIFVVNYK